MNPRRTGCLPQPSTLVINAPQIGDALFTQIVGVITNGH